MSTLEYLDPEILPILDILPGLTITSDTLPLVRHALKQTLDSVDAAAHGVMREEVRIPGLTPAHPEIRGLLYSPLTPSETMAAYLHLHGGGYIVGSPEMSDTHNIRLSASLSIYILSIDYRLAPEHPVPAALDDSYAALRWLNSQAQDLRIDPARIAVGGESAGGGLAAALVLRACETGEYPICFQLLTYPMLDDRTGQDSHPADPLTGEFIWTREQNYLGWSYYLGDTKPSAPHVPARAENLDGLPPTWIATAALDLFRDENIDYAQRLLKAGIATELIVYPRTCHGFNLVPHARVSKQYFRDQSEALGRGLKLIQ